MASARATHTPSHTLATRLRANLAAAVPGTVATLDELVSGHGDARISLKKHQTTLINDNTLTRRATTKLSHV